MWKEAIHLYNQGQHLSPEINKTEKKLFLLLKPIVMPQDIQEIFFRKIKPLNFERTIGLFGATTIGVGALMGAGIYVLVGAAAGVAGPSVILTYFITGVLAFVTTLMYAELGRIIPLSLIHISSPRD